MWEESAMRNVIFSVLLACAVACAISSAVSSVSYAQAIDDPNAESKIIALERISKMQASGAKDMKTLSAILDDGFVYTDPNGRLLTKGDTLAFVEAAHTFECVIDAMDVRLHGDTAIVTGLYRMSSVEHGRPFIRRGRFVDTWMNKNGRWVAVASVATPVG
jgi:ketosteroid isomerase-like protein